MLLEKLLKTGIVIIGFYITLWPYQDELGFKVPETFFNIDDYPDTFREGIHVHSKLYNFYTKYIADNLILEGFDKGWKHYRYEMILLNPRTKIRKLSLLF